MDARITPGLNPGAGHDGGRERNVRVRTLENVNLFKILLLLLAVGAVWYGYRRWFPPPARAADPVKDKPKPQVLAEDMKPCAVCGAYVAVGSARHCGRADCPYPKSDAP